MEITRILYQQWGIAKIEAYTEEKEKYYKNAGFMIDYIEDYHLWTIMYVNKDLWNYTKIQARRLLEKYNQLRIELWIKIIFWAIIVLTILNFYYMQKTTGTLDTIANVTKKLQTISQKKQNNLSQFNFWTWVNNAGTRKSTK